MACSRPFTNDELKSRVRSVCAKFVSDVDPDRLSDWLVQENVILLNEWHKIRQEHPTKQDRCRALLHHLLDTQHPRAFLVVREALTQQDHYLLKLIDNQEPECGIRLQRCRPTEIGLQGECTIGSEIKIDPLENQSKLPERIERRNKTIDLCEHTQKETPNDEKIKALQLENDQLRAKLKDLEQRLYPKENVDYVDKPVLAYTIKLYGPKQRKPISGITILGKELFVVTKCSPEMEVFDSKTFQHQRNMEVRGMTDPLDIASSEEVNCLYIVDRLCEESESRVMRLEQTGNELHQWPTGGRMGRLSTCGSNVILFLSDKQLINEYSPKGELIVTVRLSPAAKLNNPLHAIKVTSTHFVVSHGDFKDELHRVCVVNLDGEIIKECTKWEKSSLASRTKMKVPLCLLEDKERSIIVADTNHKRILLLSSMLKYKRKLKLIEEDDDLKRNGEDNGCLRDFPVRLCFDDTQSRLFVAVNKWSDSKKDWKDGRIQIFNIK